MISSDERFIIGMKVLERLQNGWRDGRTQINTMLETSARRKKNGHGSPSRSHNDEPDFPPSLEALLAQVGELSPYSVVLGVCEDGLPITLELDNPAPGALLISSEHKGGKTRLLRAVLASAMQLNTPDQVRIHTLDSRTESIPRDLIAQPHL